MPKSLQREYIFAYSQNALNLLNKNGIRFNSISTGFTDTRKVSFSRELFPSIATLINRKNDRGIAGNFDSLTPEDIQNIDEYSKVQDKDFFLSKPANDKYLINEDILKYMGQENEEREQ